MQCRHNAFLRTAKDCSVTKDSDQDENDAGPLTFPSEEAHIEITHVFVLKKYCRIYSRQNLTLRCKTRKSWSI